MDTHDELELMREMARLEVEIQSQKLLLKAEMKARRQQINALENRRRGIFADLQAGQALLKI